MQHGSVARRLSIAVLCLACIVQANGFAQGSREPSVYTLQRAVDQALASNPGIRAAGYAVDIATVRRDLAALPQPMSLQAEAENFLGSGAAGSFDSAETTLQLSKVLELGAKRDRRERLGNARIELAETDRSLTRLDLSAEIARRFIRLVALQEELEIAGQAVALAESALATVRRRVEVGSNSEAELATADVALAHAELERAALLVRIDAARLRLATLWGADEAGELSAEARLFELPVPQTFESLKARISDNPDLLRSVDERRILEAEKRLAETRARADLGLSFGVRRLGETDDTALVFGASLPLGRRQRADAEVSAATTALDELSARTAQRRLDAISVLTGLYAEMHTAYADYIALRDTLLPRSEQAAELYRQGFEVGSFSLLELNRAEQDLLGLRREALAAAERYHTALVDIEQLLGGTYESGVIQ
jgi:cobalt-zinc-cadmium efflux system outer membrane protein